tara:strand:+ start:239 stop:568 length:330 start_codon:yes stop_codon:yes gene_type:complete
MIANNSACSLAVSASGSKLHKPLLCHLHALAITSLALCDRRIVFSAGSFAACAGNFSVDINLKGAAGCAGFKVDLNLILYIFAPASFWRPAASVGEALEVKTEITEDVI